MRASDAERVEVHDEDGVPYGVVSRAEMRRDRLRHRAVFIAVLNGDNELLVHQRSPTKDVWPSRWDIAAGGVVGVGEAWSVAAARELAEEMGMVADLVHLGGGRFEDDDVKVIGEVFVARHDGPPTFADGEVVAARWVDSDGLEELVATEATCPDSLALVRPLLRTAGFG